MEGEGGGVRPQFVNIYNFVLTHSIIFDLIYLEHQIGNGPRHVVKHNLEALAVLVKDGLILPTVLEAVVIIVLGFIDDDRENVLQDALLYVSQWIHLFDHLQGKKKEKAVGVVGFVD